jgi:spermidine synthase
LVNQCGVPFMQAEELRETSLRRGKFFADVSAYVAAVPTYVGGFMTLGWSAKAAGMRELAPGLLRSRAAAAGVLGTTKYWSPEMQASAFVLPPYIQDQLSA